MNRLSPASSPGFLRVFIVSLLSFALLTMPLAGSVSAITLSPAPPTAKADSNIESKLFVGEKSLKQSSFEGAKVEASFTVQPSAVLLPVVNAVTATLAASLAGGDTDGDGKADAGDTISYTLQLGNTSGSDATGLSFSNPLDSHTTLVPGTLNSTPIAFDTTVTTNEDTGVSITIAGQDPDGQNLTFRNAITHAAFGASTSTTNGTLGAFSAPDCATIPGVCTSTATYTPGSNYFGSDSFTFEVNDGTANSNQVGTVSITVNGINDAPTFTQAGGSPPTASPFNPPPVLEDAGAQSVASFITGVSPGPANESGQTVTFPITNVTNSTLFSVQPLINVSGNTATLTYTSALNKNGTAVVTYHAHDTGGTANGGVDNSTDKTFTITVTAVNDAPVYSGAPKTLTVQSMMKITGQTGLLAGVTDPDAGDTGFSPQTLQVDPTTIDVTNCKNVINGVTYNCGITVTDVTAGNFDLDPPPGIGNGTVLSFTYKVKDNGNPAPGVLSAAIPVSVIVNGPIIWFVNPAAASNGIGTLSSPFKFLATATDNFHMGNLGTDQRVFVYSGTTEAGVGVSLTGVKTTAIINQAQARTKAQWLIGEGTVASSFDTLMGITPPSGTISRPTLNSNASTAYGKRPIIRGSVTMKENTFVSGVNIDVSAGGSIGLIATGLTAGTTPSVLNVSDVNVTSAGGNAVDFFSNNAQTVHYTTSDAANSPNILISTTGTALRVSDTTIGSGGFTFRSISANGGTNGILLNNTGSTAGLTILGTGGTCNTAANCTGGAIQNESGAGISLTNTQKVSIDRMFIQNTGQSGVGGTQVVDFTFTNGFINNSGTSYPANPKNDSSIGFGFDAAATENNLSGVVTITGNTLTNATEHGVDIQNFAGTITNATITNNTITSATSSANTHGSGIRLLGFGHSSGVSNITKATISGNTILNFPGGAGITAQYGNVAAGGPPGVWGTPGDATNIILIQGNFINGQSAVNPMGAYAILMTLTGRGKANWKADTNGTAVKPISNIGGTEIGVTVRGANSNSSTDVTDATCDITNNRITGIVSVNAQAIVFAADWLTTTTDKPHLRGIIANNFVSGQDGEGIQALATPGSSASVDVDIHHNNIGQPNCAGCNRFAITAQVGTSSATTTGTPSMCLNIHDNTATGSGVNPGIGIRKKTAAYVFGILNLPAGSTATPNLEAYINGLNPAGGGTTLISQTSGFTSCSSAPTASITPTNHGDDLAQNDNIFQDGNLDSLFTFSNIKTNFSSISEDINHLTQSAPTVLAADNTQSAQLVAASKYIVNDEALFLNASYPAGTDSKSASGEQTAIKTVDSVRVWSDIAPGSSSAAREAIKTDDSYSEHASASENDARLVKASFEPTETWAATKVQATASNEDSSLSHGTSQSAQVSYFASMLPMFAPTPVGSFPLNGTGTGFRLPNGKTTTITFKATLNNPPNMTGVNPPRVIAQGTLSGAFTGNPLVTDDPSTGAVNDATVTPVDLYNTSTTLGSSPNPSNSGQSVTFTATVTPAAGGPTPTGTITFKEGASTLGTGTLNGSGVATFQTSSLTVGTHTPITAEYPGDGSTDLSTSNSISQQVDKWSTTTGVASSPNPSFFNQNVTFTATVTGTGVGAPNPPTGTVTFKDGGTAICTNVTLTSGQATCQTSTLTTGAAHTITVDYNGDSNFATSTGTLSGGQTVSATKATSTAVASTPNPSSIGETVTFTATVTGSGGTPTGTVQFKDNGVNLGSAQPLNGSGVATLVTSFGTSGTHDPITAEYSGDFQFNASIGTLGGGGHVVSTCSSIVVVTNTGSTGAGSLRAAIANVCPSGTITFNIPTDGSDLGYDSGTGVFTIKLTTGGELAVNESMTITGLGANVLTVSGENLNRVFNIASGKTVNISGMSITKGQAANGANDPGAGPGGAGESGGAIINNGTLALSGVVISDSRAGNGGNSVSGVGGPGGMGGGIFNPPSATLTIDNSTLSGNWTGTGGTGASPAGGGVGGGVYNLGSLTINTSTLNGNKALGLGAEGGAIDSEGGTLIINNSTISGNSSDGEGGGLLNCGSSTATLTGVTITGNRSDTDADGIGGGGGIGQVSSNSITLNNTIVAGNFNGNGGSVLQVETATVEGAIDVAGNAQVVVTAIGLPGGTKTVTVAVAHDDDANAVADKMRAALNADTDITNLFTVTPVAGPSNQIVLTAKTAAANDSSLNIATDNDTSTGLTTKPTSVDTTAGAAGTTANDISGTMDAASSFNLIGDAGTSGGIADGTNNNIVGNSGAGTIDITTVLNTTLADNGGPTRTHALANNSPALEKGKAFGLTTDQRGFLRPVNTDATAPVSPFDDTDIGAFEAQTPAQPPSTPVLDPASDSLPLLDNTTNDISPSFIISGVTPGAFVELRRDTTIVASGIASGTTITLTDPGPLTPGSYSYTARQSLGSDISSYSTAQSITIDITPNAPDLVDASDTGVDNQDNITNDNSPTFDITGVVSGGTVELLRTTGANPPVVVASGVAAGTTIQLTDPGPVASGTHSYSARQTVSGNTSAASAGLSVTIQTTPDAPDLVNASDTGVSNSDNNTSDTTPTFDITGVVSGATVELLRDGAPIQSGTAASSTIQLTDPGPVSGGPALGGVLHSYTVRQTVSGGTSPASVALGVTVDTTLPTPSAPDLKATTDTTNNDNGASTTDNRTNAASRDFTIAGSETGSALVLLRDGNPVSNPDTGALSDGVYHYSTSETDLAGNTGTSGLLDVTFDSTAPLVSSVTRVDANPTTASTVHFTVTFNEAVTGVDAADFSIFTSGALSGASVTGVTPVDSSHYTVTVNTGTGDGNLRLDVVATDAVTPIKDAMNIPFASAFTTGEVYTIDRLNPYVISIVRADVNPTGAGVVNFTVTFSEAVQVSTVDASDFTLTTTGVAGTSIGAITPATPTNSSQFNVAVNTGTGNGTIRLNITDDDSIRDSVNKPLSPSPGTGTGNGAFTTGEVYDIDKTVPTVTLTLAAGETDPTSNTTINFTATFSKPVSGFNPSGVQITGTANATVANITPVDSQNYTVGISGMNQSGSVTVKILAGAATDNASNPSTASGSVSVTYIQDIYTTFEVNTTADTDDGACTALGTGNGCTLREAIKLANADGGVETISFNIPGADTGCTGGVCTITLGSALDNISSSMTIDGPGANVLTVKRSTTGGTPEFRIFTIASGNNDVTIDGLTLSNGDAALLTPGGGILDSSAGTLNITNSTVSGNTALQGGGISKDGAGTLNITGSTISGNTGAQGGGINISSAGTVNLTNSTVSGNFVTDSGGGISTVSATLTITNSTITNNRADSNNNGTGTGGGISQVSGTVTLKSTIVAGNFNDASPSTTADDIVGTVNAASSFNLIGQGGSGGLTNGTNSNQVGVPDPGLFPLASNGGTTQTHALQCVSSAIDKGYSFGQTTDQTGLSRVFDLADAVYPNAAAPGDGTDIGSFESQSGGGCIPQAVAPSPAPSTNEDTQVTITLKGTYAQNTVLTFTITQQPGHGTALVPTAPVCNFTSFQTCTSTVSYTPTANYNGADDFKFRVSAGGLDSDVADVAITVNAINDAPTAASQAVGTNEDTPVTITLTGSDIDSGALAFSVVSAPTHGSLGSISAPVCGGGACSATVDYTPTANYGGTDSFTFKTNDGAADSNPVGTVTISVNPQNDAPVLDNTGNMTLTAVNEDVADASNPGTLVSAIIASAGGDRITDVDTGASEGIAVIGVANTNGTWQFSINNGGTWTPFGSPDPTTARLLTANANTLVRFIPNANFNGTVNPGITFRAWDLSNGLGLNGTIADASVGGGTTPYSVATETASITVNPINDTPTASGQSVTTNEDAPLPITLSGTDQETTAANLIYTITVPPAHGTLSAGTGQNRTYTPSLNYNGPDSFKFTVTDTGDGSSAALTSTEATVSITVNAVNDAPSFTKGADHTANDPNPQTVNGWATSISAGPADEAGQTLNFIVSNDNNAIFSVQPTVSPSGTLSYTPALGANGSATVTIQLHDNGGTALGGVDTSAAQTFIITVHAQNNAPTLDAISNRTINEDAGPQTVNLSGITAGPSYESYQNLTVTATSSNTALIPNPTVTYTSPATTGTLSFTPVTDASGTATITVTVTDDGGTLGGGVNTFSRTFTVTVNTVNDAPVNHVPGNQSAQLYVPLVFSAANGNLTFISDVDAGVDPVRVTLKATNGTITLSRTTGLSFTTGDGTIDTEMTFSGTIANINAALDGMTFTAIGNGLIEITTNDLGHNGAGGALSRTNTIMITANATSFMQFGSLTYGVIEGDTPLGNGQVQVTVTRTGNLSSPATVDYQTQDGTASDRGDYDTARGTLRFAAGQGSASFFVMINDDAYLEGSEDFQVRLTNATVGVGLGIPSTATVTITDNDTTAPTANTTDDIDDFVRQLYHDFLDREPEADGFNYWTTILRGCHDDACLNSVRVEIASRFFQELEFQLTGYFVMRLYKAAYGRFPTYQEFVRDRRQVGMTVESQQAFAEEFVQRPEFTAIYGSLNNPQFVDLLFDTANLKPYASERQAQVYLLEEGKGRGQVIHNLVELPEFRTREFNPAFVRMMYFGFLRRDAEATGEAYWLNVINNLTPNNYRGMICAFLNSFEYHLRFSSVRGRFTELSCQ